MPPLELVLAQAETLLRSSDPWLRRSALATLASQAQLQYQEIFESRIFDPDSVCSLLSFQGLKRIFPATINVDIAWRELFGESVELLCQRAATGPVSLRTAALETLAFAPIPLTKSTLDAIFQNIKPELLVEGIASAPPAMPLVNTHGALDLTEGFSLVLASLAEPGVRKAILQRELALGDPDRLLPALLTLQISPEKDFLDEVLKLLRSHNPIVAVEAARAVLMCGGPKVFLVIAAVLNETADPWKKSQLLPILGQTGRPEVGAILLAHLGHSSADVRRAAVGALEFFPLPETEKTRALTAMIDDGQPEVRAEALRILWHLGSLESLTRLEKLVGQGNSRDRSVGAEALGRLPPNVVLPILLDALSREKFGDTRRELLLALRRLLPKTPTVPQLFDRIFLSVKRLLESPEPFLRSQAAVLCGNLGHVAEDTILSCLEREEHPHVIASLIGALGKTGNPRLLILARFHDYPDPRVRANLMGTLMNSGNSGIPYLTAGLRDPASRVRAAAATSLFCLGQADVVAVLNRMLLVPTPISVMSACHALGKLMRISLPALKADHPVSLMVSRGIQKKRKAQAGLPVLLREEDLPKIFTEFSRVGNNLEGLEHVLFQYLRKKPSSHAVQRMLSAVYLGLNKPSEAILYLEGCLKIHPHILADQFDGYRLSVTLGDMKRAEQYKRIILETYKKLHDACRTLCQEIRGQGAEEIQERLHHLTSPSMNLYNAMIQLKMIQGETEVVLDLLSELLLARPTNAMVVQKIATFFPEKFPLFRQALLAYSKKLSGPGKN